MTVAKIRQSDDPMTRWSSSSGWRATCQCIRCLLISHDWRDASKARKKRKASSHAEPPRLPASPRPLSCTALTGNTLDFTDETRSLFEGIVVRTATSHALASNITDVSHGSSRARRPPTPFRRPASSSERATACGTLNSKVSVDQDRLAEFCRQDGVRRLAVFGSALRDDFGPSSDVDVLIEFEPRRTPGLRFFWMQEELSRLFDRTVDLHTPVSLIWATTSATRCCRMPRISMSRRDPAVSLRITRETIDAM